LNHHQVVIHTELPSNACNRELYQQNDKTKSTLKHKSKTFLLFCLRGTNVQVALTSQSTSILKQNCY